MASTLTVFLLISSASSLFAEESGLLVSTRVGNVEGFYKTSSRGRSYRAFEGIPYAQPPVHSLRFEPPQPFGSWEGTLKATKPKSMCTQYVLGAGYPGKVVGNEDCLYLNIYTPLSNETKKGSRLLPVFFWIHGGAFQFLDGHSQGSSYIMNRDLIYVTFNYRLGILGFMSTEDAIVPGNMGLKDQNLALRWIHDNIMSFGGDPARITIAGGSAGGVSAHYHYLSPKSSGLFRGGMSFSGTTLNCWAQTEESAAKARKLASLQGCPTNNTRDMVECLKSRPATGIVALTQQFQPWLMNPFTPFGPVVEKNSTDPFIDRSPVEIIDSGSAAPVPWVTSVVSEEGLFPAVEFVENEGLMAELDEKWEELAPHLLDFNFTIPKSRHAEVAAAIREHYLGSDRVERATAERLIHMIGDRLFTADAANAAMLMAKNTYSPIRFYYYSYRNTFSLTDMFNVTGNFGVSHGDDYNLIITNPRLPVVTDEPTLNVQNTLLDIIESFMKWGTPPPEIHWPTVDPSQEYFNYLHILGPGKLKAMSSLNFAERKFWSSLDFDENKLQNV
ncbi:venom carboxylesterase-6 [Diachasma alloeum]|uniref:venom carboxylesterase-6 n=1 Tax=Diachasma alloeum TaxID=454923 RepID=UPI0007384A8D|nr:venom carboxylesterase-6 [Diachasma alloeum]